MNHYKLIIRSRILNELSAYKNGNVIMVKHGDKTFDLNSDEFEGLLYSLSSDLLLPNDVRTIRRNIRTKIAYMESENA